MDNTTKERFITEYRGLTTQFIDLMATSDSLRKQYDSLDLGSLIEDTDFVGVNAGITKAELLAAIASMGTIDTLCKTGHYTNLYNVAR